VKEISAWISVVEENSWNKSSDVHCGRFGYEYVEQIITIALKARALDVSFLLFEGTPIAFVLGFVSDRQLRYCCMGYDSRAQDLSPGFLLRAELVRSTCEQTVVTEIELGGSRHHWKRQEAESFDSGYEITIYSLSVRGIFLFLIRRLFSNVYSWD
jgi:hypothetical protein